MLDNDYMGNKRPNDDSCVCPAVGTHYALVDVPVTVKPFAIPRRVTVECCDTPHMQPGDKCRGKIGAVCHFTVSQLLKIEIPIDFGACVKVGEAHIDCGKPLFECCDNCMDNCMDNRKDDCKDDNRKDFCKDEHKDFCKDDNRKDNCKDFFNDNCN